MSEVKRIAAVWSDVCESIQLRERQDGEFVNYEDYATLQQQLAAASNSLTNAQEALKSAGIEADTVQAGVMELKAQGDALAAENAALKGFGDKLNDMHNKLNGEGTGIQGRAEVACQQVALEAAMDEFDTIIIPATDAYLNSVRAGFLPAGLHPSTSELVLTFAKALAEKLHRSEQKYGWSDGWKNVGWQDKCLADFHHHISKGDPRDVAAYCAFMWYHGWPTQSAPAINLNAVRAEGADAAAFKIRKAIPAFKDIHCGAVKECADIAEMVAVQFMTGSAGKDGSHE